MHQADSFKTSSTCTVQNQEHLIKEISDTKYVFWLTQMWKVDNYGKHLV